MFNWEVLEVNGSKALSERIFLCPKCHDIKSKHKYIGNKIHECPVCHTKLKYPFERITNKQWLLYASNEEIANWLTTYESPCDYCEIVEDCIPKMYPGCRGTNEAWSRWLNDIHNED